MSSVNLDGNPIELSGKFPETGDNAPPFTLTNSGLEEVKLDNWSGKRKILNIIPSIDTGVCAASTRKFNEKAGSLDNTVVLVVSADLPFAAARFCGAEGRNPLDLPELQLPAGLRRRHSGWPPRRSLRQGGGRTG